MGGHGYVYDYVPKDEIWIDENLKDKPDDMEATIKHEVFEVRKMRDEGLTYEQAHELANNIEKRERQKEVLNDSQSKIGYLKNKIFIETGEKKIDENYEPDDAGRFQRKVLFLKYNNLWHYADNTDPDSELFNKINEAITDLTKEGRGEPDKDYSPIKETILLLQENWVDIDNNVIEEGDMISYSDFAYSNPENDFVKEFGLENSIAFKSFDTRESTADELLNKVYFDIDKDIIKEYEENGVKLKISTQKTGKYRSINIENENGDEIGSIKLRIADHSYNPQNNDIDAQSGNFISVEIANKNETEGRFHGKYGIQFTGDSEYNDVIDAVNERIKEIIYSWKIKSPTMEKEVRQEPDDSKYMSLTQNVFGTAAGSIGRVISKPNMFVTNLYFGKNLSGQKLEKKIDNTYLKPVSGKVKVMTEGLSEVFVVEVKDLSAEAKIITEQPRS